MGYNIYMFNNGGNMRKQYFIVDSFSDLRINRQTRNNQKCASSLLKECINPKQKTRTFDSLLRNHPDKFKNESQILLYIEKDPVARSLMGMICSINSSRQGAKDEDYVISGIKEALEPRLPNFNIDNLKPNDMVPIRGTGEVLTRKKAKKKYSKTEMLKSFDFNGKVGGKLFYGSAKIVVGKGGHQDNVLHEEADLLRWLSSHRKKDCFYFILLDFEGHDPKDIEDIKGSNNMSNVFICNHIELQKKLEELND